MLDKVLSISRRTRSTPFSSRVEAAGVKAYTVYNHMLLPTMFESFEADYYHLCEYVQVWDVSVERQVEIKGPDCQRLVQLMTPRDISRVVDGQCIYTPLCDETGSIINDPIAIRLSANHWWLSIADSDVKLWAKGLASGFGLDVTITEPDVFPLAVQGPMAEQLVARLFGDRIKQIRFFRGEMLDFKGTKMFVARSGWSKQGGFEIYLNNPDLAEALWDELFELGKDLSVKAGCPNIIERIENGLLSYGNDIDYTNNPFECGLDQYINLDAEIDSLSLPALRQIAGKHTRQLVGFMFDQMMLIEDKRVLVEGRLIGEITSHTWSSRYRKYLVFVMIQKDFFDRNKTIEINGTVGRICHLPFSKEDLNH